jgi:peptidylprolyl isomerase
MRFGMIRILAALALLLTSVFTADKSNFQTTIHLDTKDGRIVIGLRTDLAPQHVERIKTLIREKFYDNVPFHRVIPVSLRDRCHQKFMKLWQIRFLSIPHEGSRAAQ